MESTPSKPLPPQLDPVAASTMARAGSADAQTSPAKLNANAKSFVPIDGAAATPVVAATPSRGGGFSPSKALGPPGAPTPFRPPLPTPPLPPGALSYQQMLYMQMLHMQQQGMGMPPVPGLGVPSPMHFAPVPSPMQQAQAQAPTPVVSVGNAALHAYKSNAPPKLCCVLVTGLPRAGKTSLAEQLVKQLGEEQIPWAFFSGSHHIKTVDGQRQPSWDTTRQILDALSLKLDQLLEEQKEKKIRGIVIDKNIKCIEDVYYLVALLRTKDLALSGIVCLDSSDDAALLARIGGEDGIERMKFYRVIMATIQEATRSAGIFHAIDASKPMAEAVRYLRTQVLGFSSLQKVKTISTAAYGSPSCTLVDDYKQYCHVMHMVCSLHKTPKQYQFPGVVNYTPLQRADLEGKKLADALRDQSVVIRRKPDGSKFVLYHEEGALYLVPRHMRGVMRISSEAWLGFPLHSCGSFILDGELVRHRTQENTSRFLVTDAIYWAELGSTTNTCIGSWNERQDRLKARLCNEEQSFQAKTDIIVVHQTSVPIQQLPALLKESDFLNEGIVFQPTAGREPPMLWRPPKALTVDLRLGAITSAAATDGSKEGPGSKDAPTAVQYEVEVLDANFKCVTYARHGTVQVCVQPRHPKPVVGTIVSCGLDYDVDSVVPRGWRLAQVRSDLHIPAFKSKVDELLDHSIIAEEQLVAAIAAAGLLAGDSKGPEVPQRGGFGTALPSSQVPAQPSMADKLRQTSATKATPPPKEATAPAKEAKAPVGEKPARAAKAERPEKVRPEKPAPAQRKAERAEGSEKPVPAAPPATQTCPGCKQDVAVVAHAGESRCLPCWLEKGVSTCAECAIFTTGHAETKGKHAGRFFCEPCWVRYDEHRRKSNAGREAKARAVAPTPATDEAPAAPPQE